jgi:hypothetical protein
LFPVQFPRGLLSFLSHCLLLLGLSLNFYVFGVTRFEVTEIECQDFSKVYDALLLAGDIYSGLLSGIPCPCRLLSGLRGLKPLPTFLDLPPRLSYVVELRFSPRREG